MKSLIFGLVFLQLLSISSLAAETDPKHVVLHPSAARSALPFSDGVLVGNTFYVAGTIGFDVTGKVPASAEQEAKLAMDGVKQVVESEGMTMDDLVSVQVFCTDLALYDTFNGVYRTYFRDQFPARAFLGAASLVRGAHFEVMGIAIRRAK
ncbi:MAG TPA: RidA family protein [Terriglobales bacterium]|jgi:2-iminobutanoate/2-iminopropanoate deaminase|nr:RidA family protein [Terriglobales bacterium]